MSTFEKSLADERVRVTKLLNRYERFIKRAFLVFISTVKSEAVMKEVRLLLEANRLQDAYRIATGSILSFANALPIAFQAIGIAEASAISNVLSTQRNQRLTVSVSFDPTHPRAAELMRNSKTRFASALTAEQEITIREALAESLLAGSSFRQAAEAFRNSVGLSPAQLATVNKYATLVRSGSLDALDRELRDRRFDRTLENSSAQGIILPRQIQSRMVSRYRERLLQQRANVISRTETLPVLHMARDEAMRQALEMTGLAASRVERRWNTSIDGRERDSHHQMHGQVRGLDEPFTTPSGINLMFPGDPAAPGQERINCRCTVTMRIGTR